MLFYFALSGPNFISSEIINDEHKNVQQIRSTTDLHELQNIAAIQTEETANVMSCAKVTLIMAAVTFLLCTVVAGINLRQLQHLRRDPHEAIDTTPRPVEK
jgi:hypothetical protein